MKIDIVDYNPEWPRRFEEEKQNLLTLFGTHALSIDHVGSTAIPQQRAKPIVDIFIGVSPLLELSFYQTLFDREGYAHVPTDMTGRYLFAKYTQGVWTHNLHVLPYNREFPLRNEFLLRDYLREHPQLVAEYGEIKKKAAIASGSTMEEYTRAKTAFIQRVVDAARQAKGLPLQPVWES